MAVKASASITIAHERNIHSLTRFYKIASSTSTPTVPTENQGKAYINSGTLPSGWSKAEPAYDGTSTNSLFTCDLTGFTDGSVSWSPVSKSSSYEAAKQAYNEAQNAKQTATNYVTDLSNGTFVHADGTPSDPTDVNAKGVRITDQIDIIRNGKTVAKFGESAAIGTDDGSQSYMKLDYHSMQMIDKEGNKYFHVSDLRDRNGRLTETFTSGNVAAYDLAAPADTIMTVLVNDVSTTEYTRTDFSLFTRIILDTRPEVGSEVKIIYTPNTTNTKAYTLGTRNNGNVDHIGMYSVAEGFNLISSGMASHAEGANCEANGVGGHAEGWETHATHDGAHSEGEDTKAWGDSAHAEGCSTIAKGFGAHSEGYKTTAYGFASHAQNIGSYAKKDAQTVIGTCAKIDSATTTTHPDTSGDYDYGQYALIIGNGVLTGPNTASRSNALTVDWNGVPVGHNSNGTEIDYEISDATIAKYVALGMSTT